MRCELRIETSDPSRLALKPAISDRLLAVPLPAEQSASDAVGLIVALRDDAIELREQATKPGRGLSIDLAAIIRGGANAGGLSRRQPLARAMGRASRRIIDATAGLGHDATLLAAMGYEVLAIERHPLLHLMLDDALRRASDDTRFARLVGNRLRIMQGDARELFSGPEDTCKEWSADCIYIDPMFPPKRRPSALAKKEIRLVRALVGDDVDAQQTVHAARALCRRVVVKRPHHAPPLEPGVSAVIESKLVRYDIYVGSASLRSTGAEGAVDEPDD